MSNIQKANTGISTPFASADVSLPVKEILKELSTAKVGQSLPNDIFWAAKSGIEKSFLDTEFKMPGDMQYVTTEVTKHIKKMHPSIRLGEIPVAFARGIRKQYGDYMGLSVLSFCNFIDGYVKDEDRKKALTELAKAQSGQEDPLPEWDKVYDMSKANALRALSEVEAGKSIFLYGSIVYDFLDALGLMEYSVEEKNQFYSKAYTMILNERRAAREMEFDKFRRDSLQSLIDVMERNDNEALKRMKETEIIKNRAKCLTLKSYLEALIFEETDLEAIIEGRREEMRRRYDEQSQKGQIRP